jgi:hypothetical protein
MQDLNRAILARMSQRRSWNRRRNPIPGRYTITNARHRRGVARPSHHRGEEGTVTSISVAFVILTTIALAATLLALLAWTLYVVVTGFRRGRGA